MQFKYGLLPFTRRIWIAEGKTLEIYKVVGVLFYAPFWPETALKIYIYMAGLGNGILLLNIGRIPFV